jgi:hypothetical protein
LATVAQSRSVAGLTVLALIYIPLSYVAVSAAHWKRLSVMDI